VFSESKIINYSELKIDKELGRGGFGVVYQGTWRHNDVAVKKLLVENISFDAAEEFEKEAKVMAQLRSPNIVQFYGYCVSPNYCIVMEYMPNGSLFSVLRSHKPLEWPTRFKIAVDIAKGLAFLHEENILHRDIKSLNVLLGSNHEAKLTDFGLSKVKNETRSHTVATKTKSDSVGTTQWMAPELFKGRKAVFTYKSDIYSLAVTFWEIASRKIPFSDASSPDLIPTWVQQGDREDIPTDCPPALSALIQACWEGDPNKRPGADDVVTRLKSAIEGASSHGSASTSSGIKYEDNFHSAQSLSLQHPKSLISRSVSRKSLLFSWISKAKTSTEISQDGSRPSTQVMLLSQPAQLAQLAITNPTTPVNPTGLSRVPILVEKEEKDQADEEGRTQLWNAAFNGKIEVIQALLGAGVMVDQPNNNGETSLYAAALNGHTKALKALLKANAKVNQPSNNGLTPLHGAAGNGHLEIVQVLLKAGAIVDHADNEGYTPLCTAVISDHVKVVQALLKADANVNHLSNDGRTPLWIVAAFTGNMGILQALLKAGANINHRNNASGQDGDTPLLLAACNGFVEVLQTLLKAGAKVDEPNNDGFTPLHGAVCNDQVDTLRALLKAGANKNLKYRDKSPLEVATEKQNWGIMVILEQPESTVSAAFKKRS